MNARRIKIDHWKVALSDLKTWLAENDYVYTIKFEHDIPTSNMVIDELSVYIELYTDEAETALRLQWETK